MMDEWESIGVIVNMTNSDGTAIIHFWAPIKAEDVQKISDLLTATYGPPGEALLSKEHIKDIEEFREEKGLFNLRLD